MGWPVLAMILMLSTGCPGSSVTVPRDAGTGHGVKGRVVDFETCLTAAGCQGVAGLRVGLFHDTTIFSAPTTDSGAFALANVPDGPQLLLVSDALTSGQVLPTLNAEPVVTHDADLTGVELMVLRRSGALYAGISSEAGVDVDTNMLYLGQVFGVSDGSMLAIQNVTISSSPTAAVRYVRCPSSFSQCAGETTLFDPGHSGGTSNFGEFVLIGASSADYTISASSTLHSFAPVQASLGRGYITVGLHRSLSPAAPDSAAALQDSGL